MGVAATAPSRPPIRYIPECIPYDQHAARVVAAFESHLSHTMEVHDLERYRLFMLINDAVYARLVSFTKAFKHWLILLRDFDRAFPGHALLSHFLAIPRTGFVFESREHPTTQELFVKITSTKFNVHATYKVEGVSNSIEHTV